MIPVLLVLSKCFYLLNNLSNSSFYSGPPPFGLSRPPFFPGPFLPHPPPNAFIMHPRFPMPNSGPHGMMSPIAPLITNGSDANNSEIIDSQSNEVLASPATDGKYFYKIK